MSQYVTEYAQLAWYIFKRATHDLTQRFPGQTDMYRLKAYEALIRWGKCTKLQIQQALTITLSFFTFLSSERLVHENP